MRRLITFAFVISLLAAAIPQPAFAVPPAGDKPICVPGAYTALPEDCEPLGPSAYLQRAAEQGIQFPMAPLAFTPIDESLSVLNINFALVSTFSGEQAVERPFFTTLEDAVAYTNPAGYMKYGTSSHYVSYTSVQEVGGTNYYLTENGWMRRSDLSPAQVRQFSLGIEFDATPSRPFGWVLEFANGETAPFRAWQDASISAARTEITHEAYSLLQVYDIRQEGELSWYLVGPDTWLNSLQMRLVFPVSEPPEGVENGRWIEINLEQQTYAVYDNNQMVFATMIATGLDNLWTRPGLFQIYEKHETTTMSGDFSGGTGGYYFLSDVPWTMYYDEARAIHGAYWRPKQFFGFQGSHGCVNLALGDAHWMFDWADIGDWVYVHDPSGRTPTDDEFSYGPGAP